MDNTYTISQLAKEFDVTTRTIRFYEDEGLIHPKRLGSRRIYSNRDHTRLKLILRGKRLGLSLGELLELFDIYDNPHRGGHKGQLQKCIAILEDRRIQLEQQKKDINAALQEIQQVESKCREVLKRLKKTK